MIRPKLTQLGRPWLIQSVDNRWMVEMILRPREMSPSVYLTLDMGDLTDDS